MRVFLQIEECLVCSDKKSSVLFKPCGHMCVCDSCSQIMKKCVLCRAQIELMVPMAVCAGGLGNISEVRQEVEVELPIAVAVENINLQPPLMNNGSRDTNNDIQKLQQQLQDIKEQVGNPNLTFTSQFARCKCPIRWWKVIIVGPSRKFLFPGVKVGFWVIGFRCVLVTNSTA